MPNGKEVQQRNDNAALRNAGFQTIVKTTHILSHSVATIMLVLDEETGGYKLRLTLPRCADEDFLRALRRWIRQIGRGWQKRRKELKTVSK
jgi:hypothetical protein